jgi:hypothetical protein
MIKSSETIFCQETNSSEKFERYLFSNSPHYEPRNIHCIPVFYKHLPLRAAPYQWVRSSELSWRTAKAVVIVGWYVWRSGKKKISQFYSPLSVLNSSINALQLDYFKVTHEHLSYFIFVSTWWRSASWRRNIWEDDEGFAEEVVLSYYKLKYERNNIHKIFIEFDMRRLYQNLLDNFVFASKFVVCARPCVCFSMHLINPFIDFAETGYGRL